MKKQRQQGMDRLRILAAFFVVGIHLFSLIGHFDERGPGLARFVDAFVYALVFSAVNCFGLLSGYMGYREEGNGLRLSALIALWLQFLFYRVFFLFVPSLAGLAAPVKLTDILLPLTKRVNWYITCYFEMMLFAPAVNLVVRQSSRRANALMGLCLFAVCTAATLLRAGLDCDPFLLGEGYNWMWLAILYFWGASVKKHGLLRGLSTRAIWLLLLAALLLMSGWRWLTQGFFPPEGFPGHTEKLFYRYTSPTLVIVALCLLLLHERLGPELKCSVLTERAASASLGVFLLHTTVWYWLIEPNAALLSPFPSRFTALNVLLSALVITLLCIPVDLARGWLFEKLGVRRLAKRTEDRVFTLANLLAQRLEALSK